METAAGLPVDTYTGKSSGLVAFRLVAIFVILLMIALAANIAINDDFGHGSGLDTFNAGAASPWQLFINMDLMAGLFLALAWIVWRNLGTSLPGQIAWVALVLWWGNIIVAIYMLHALSQSRGHPEGFFMGTRALPEPSSRGRALGSALQIASLIGALLAGAYMVHGLIATSFTGISAFGYLMAFGTITYGLAVHAFSRPARY